jgi:hypothetical protein
MKTASLLPIVHKIKFRMDQRLKFGTIKLSPENIGETI